MFYPSVTLYVAIVTCAKCAAESDLRIEYNQTFDNQTNLDKLYIAFVNKANSNETAVNKVNTNGTLIVYVNTEHLKALRDKLHLKKSSCDIDKLYLSYTTGQKNGDRIGNVNADCKENIAVFKKLQSSDIKRKLDRFTMSKRNTFQVTPPFEMPAYKSNYDDANDSNNNVIIVLDKESYELQKNNGFSWDHNTGDITSNHVTPYLSNNVQAMRNNDPAYTNNGCEVLNDSDRKTKPDTITDNGKQRNQDAINLLSHPQLAEILRKQKDLIEKLEGHLQNETRTYLRSDFDDIMDFIQMNKKENKTLPTQKRITHDPKLTTRAPPASPGVEMLVDETKVREALRKNPLVQRILKMAKQKKAEYKRSARKYYNNLLYT